MKPARHIPAAHPRRSRLLWSLALLVTGSAACVPTSAPDGDGPGFAVDSIRQTLRGDLADRIRAATDHERAEQERLQKTADFAEGVAAMAQRRKPEFHGR